MLEQYWYIACLSSELGRKPVRKKIMGRQVVLFRTANGVAALKDSCAHRAAPLSAGRVVNNNIECPYHGWCYGGDGRVTHIPSEGGCVKNKLDIEVESYSCKEQQSYIWIMFDKECGETDPFRFPHVNDSGWTSFRMKTRFHATVESCLENFLDCPHATHVHNRWFRSPTSKKVKATVECLNDGAIAEYFKEPREKSLVWSLLSPQQEAMKHTDRYIAPSTSRVDYSFSGGRRFIITSSCTPVSDDETEVYTVISFKYKLIGPLVRMFFKPLSKIIIKQDVKMLKLQQDNINMFGSASFNSVTSDLLGPYIIQWRTSLKNRTTPPKAGEKHNVELWL